jgi:hypothetical protein
MDMSNLNITCGDFDALRKIVELIGVSGRWAETQNHCQFRAPSGAVLNYWKTTGTINFQGSERAAAELKAMVLQRAIVIE